MPLWSLAVPLQSWVVVALSRRHVLTSKNNDKTKTKIRATNDTNTTNNDDNNNNHISVEQCCWRHVLTYLGMSTIWTSLDTGLYDASMA